MVGNILDDLKRELSREEGFATREKQVLARTDQIKLKNKFESRRSSSKKREITRIDSLEKREITRIDSLPKQINVNNQDEFYNNSLIKQPSKVNETLNLELDTIKALTNADQLK
jgi:hypothetical protein